MKTQSTLFLSILTTSLLVITPDAGSCQNSAVQWFSFNSGFGIATSSMTIVKSSAGQLFVGSSQQANSLIESGFLGAPLLRGPIVGVGEDLDLPLKFSLGQNYPNPFNPSTTIRYELAGRRKVELVIYNLLGQRIVTLVNEEQDAGRYSIGWNGRDKSGAQVSSGMYLYRIHAESTTPDGSSPFFETKKVILLR